ncbi:MAG TPA: TolC family protein [bacterium]|nr:TolC family protein [bacterium]HQG44736.1 TolC family protein [bacterium]HQI49398.1 TolC family protein [bacterium]HQJ65328.1 TolC family protein [bacterium]
MKKTMVLSCAVTLMVLSAAHGQKTLTLAESVRLALEKNSDIRNSRLEIAAADQARAAALTRYFPDISAGWLYFDASKALFELRTPGGNLPVYDGNPVNLLHPTQYAYFPSSTTSMLQKGEIGYLDILLPLYTGGRIVNGNRLAALGKAAVEDKSELTRDEVVLSTSEQYFRMLSLDEKRATLKHYEALLDNLQLQVETAYASGLVMRNDLLKVKLKRSEVQLNQSRLEHGRKLAAMSLCQYIGIAYDSTLSFQDQWPAVEAPDPLFIDPHQALRGRNEYRLLEKSLRAEKLQTRMKRGALLPQVGIGARTMAIHLDQSGRRTLGIFFGSLSIPISDWIGGMAELEERRLREKIAENTMENQTGLLLLQLEKAWQDLADAYQQVLLAEESRLQTGENLKVNETSYQNGLTTLSDLLEAQALQQQALDQLTETKADYRIKKCRYLQMTGRSGETY